LLATLIGSAVAALVLAYVLYRKRHVTTQKFDFHEPQDGVSSLLIEIREDTVLNMYLLYQDGTINKVMSDEPRGKQD